MLRTKTAIKICSNWHNGQWSSFYQFASSGVYMIENHLRYLQEVETDLHPEYNLYPGELNKKDENDLNNLKAYFIKCGENSGINTEFHQHTLYGYYIPFITENTPDELANKVSCIAYMK